MMEACDQRNIRTRRAGRHARQMQVPIPEGSAARDVREKHGVVPPQPPHQLAAAIRRRVCSCTQPFMRSPRASTAVIAAVCAEPPLCEGLDDGTAGAAPSIQSRTSEGSAASRSRPVRPPVSRSSRSNSGSPAAPPPARRSYVPYTRRFPGDGTSTTWASPGEGRPYSPPAASARWDRKAEASTDITTGKTHLTAHFCEPCRRRRLRCALLRLSTHQGTRAVL